MNRSTASRGSRGSKESDIKDTGSSPATKVPVHRLFTVSGLRGLGQPEICRKTNHLIGTEKLARERLEDYARERNISATQLTAWADERDDDAVGEVSDKLVVLIQEMVAQDEAFAVQLEDYREHLKAIRETEKSVLPTREAKAKLVDEIKKLKYKEPGSTRIPQLQQELVRTEASSLVAEAQLHNVTRQMLKEGFGVHFRALLERSEKQAILARHAYDLLGLLDDAPIVPGEACPLFEHGEAARAIIISAEDSLRGWKSSLSRSPMAARTLPTGLEDAGSSEVGTEGTEAGTVPPPPPPPPADLTEQGNTA